MLARHAVQRVAIRKKEGISFPQKSFTDHLTNHRHAALIHLIWLSELRPGFALLEIIEVNCDIKLQTAASQMQILSRRPSGKPHTALVSVTGWKLPLHVGTQDSSTSHAAVQEAVV